MLCDALKRDRGLFYEAVGAVVNPQTGKPLTPLKRKAFVDEHVARLENAIDPKAAPVKVRESQDRPDAGHLRLTYGGPGCL